MPEDSTTLGSSRALLMGAAVTMAVGELGCLAAAAGRGGGLGVGAAVAVVAVGIGASLALGGIAASGAAPVRGLRAAAGVVAGLAVVIGWIGLSGEVALGPAFVGALIVGAGAALIPAAAASGGRIVAGVALAGVVGWALVTAGRAGVERLDDRRDARRALELEADAAACIEQEWSSALSRSRAASRVERCLWALPGGEHWTCLPSVCSYTDRDDLEETVFAPLPSG